MLQANTARVEWDNARKRWEVVIEVGAEVIKRPISNAAAQSGEAALKDLAIRTARDEGYEVDPAKVSVEKSGHAA